MNISSVRSLFAALIALSNVLRFHIIVEDRESLPDVGDEVVGADFQAVHVHHYAFVRPASSAFHHASPVLEWGTHQCIWRYHGEGVVPVAYLDGVQGYFLDRAVCASVRHLYPVSEPYHVVLRKLHTRNESENAVLEYQHKYCCRGTESGQKNYGRFVYQDGYYDYAADEDEHYLQALDEPFERSAFMLVALVVIVQECQQNGVAYHDGYDDHIYDVDPVQYPDNRQAFAECDPNQQVEQDSRYEQQEIVAEPAFAEQ